MKPVIYKVSIVPDSSFSVREVKLPYFDATWHFHEEYELVLVTKGTGKRFIGSHISDYEAGDLAFLGPGLPHLYRSDEACYQNPDTVNTVSIVIQFSENFLGKAFLDIPEMKFTKRLFEKSVLGLQIYGETRSTVSKKMQELLTMQGLERLTHLLSILNILSVSGEHISLSKPGMGTLSQKDTERMNLIYDFVLKKYREPIQLQEVADLVNMSISPFCRYFKKRTKKTFSHFLTEIRIGYACRLLLEDNLNITQISLESGFNNISNFNRHFKLITGKNPLNYKRELAKDFRAERIPVSLSSR